MAFLGGALSHAVLPERPSPTYGAHSTALGAFFAGLFTAAGIGFVGRHPDLKQDTAIGILMSGMFALGIAIISTIKTYTVDLANFLFGNVLAVSMADIWLMMCISVLILLALWLFHHRWVILGFDPNFAAAVGLPVRALHYGLMVSISLVIVAAMKVVGVIQVVAMLVTPPATARLLSNRLSTMMWLSALLGSLAAVVGLYVSYYLNVASGAAIVIVSVVIFFAVFLNSSRRIAQGVWKSRE